MPPAVATGVGGVVLAAGGSSRMGRPKQLLPWRGRPLLQHVIDAMAAAGLAETVVVLGRDAAAIAEAMRLPDDVRVVENPDHAAGQSTSLRAGLRALGPGVAAAVVALGDQPELAAEAVRAVVESHREGAGPVVQARYRGTAGHPILLDRAVWPKVMAATGDRGAREVLAAHPAWVHPVEVDRDPPRDVDTREEYEGLLEDGAP